jgi:hypothetical protein
VFGYTGRLAADMEDLATIEQELAHLPEGSGRDRAVAMARGSAPHLSGATATTPTRARTARPSWPCCAPGWCRTASISSTSPRPRCRRRACSR